jgi:hypothetical protein
MESFSTLCFQHMAIYDIAKALRRYYGRPGQESEKIEILFQDPSYKPRDEKVLRELHYHMGCTETSTIKFVNDPDGLLAITRNTLVVTVFVPNQYPLLQIIADLYARGSGPAAIFCERIHVDTKQELYKIYNRASPAVARMIAHRYVILDGGFEKHELEPDLTKDMNGGTGETGHWFHGMDLYVRKRAQWYDRGGKSGAEPSASTHKVSS